MSALRISRPGIAGTTLIPLDDGASPRIDAARSTSSRFTPLTDVRPPFSGMTGVEIRPSSIAGAHKRKAMTVVPGRNVDKSSTKSRMRVVDKPVTSTQRNPDDGGVQAPISEVPS